MVGGEISFGRLRLDLARRELRRDNSAVRLGSRALDILCVLASADGEVVTKDELMARVWGGVVVEENNLQVHISALRKTLEEGGNDGSWIVTVPGRGYRLLRSPDPPPGDTSAPTPGAPLPDKASVAVLPFQNMSGDPEQEYFADGMVEEITTAISHLPWLFVIARNSSFTYKGKAVDVKQVARELGVRYVLEGSVRKADNRVRITGQLIDTASGAHIWADRFDGTLDDIFGLQDRVAASVVGAIEPKLRQSEIERANRKPTESLDAYDLYLRAVASRYGYTEAGIREAVALLERALAIDPTYASAAAMIGWCRIHQLAHGLGTVSDAEISEAVRLARRAIEAGKDDPDVLWMSGYTLMRFAGERATAGNLVDRAVALNPNSAHAWHVRGVFLLLAHDPEGAIAALEHAMRLSPVDPLGRAFSTAVAGAHFGAHRYERAEDWADRSLAMQPNYRPALHLKAACCAHLGRIGEARVWADRILELEPGLTIARWKTMVPPFPPDLLARYEDGLRKAGLAEK